jgi:uncharacterized protein
MLYKSFHGLQLSTLGMGNMRLPARDSKGNIEEGKARQIVEYVYEHGVNYFDTAYRYHNGESEIFIGKVLKQYPRDSWYLASKMPGHMLQAVDGKIMPVGYLQGEAIGSVEEIFEDQLKRCGVEYFDFYLLHNVCETAFNFYTDKDIRVVDYLLEQKKAGRIRHFGFSAHGRAETIARFLDLYDCFEFVQLQINTMDWVLQDAKRKYELAVTRGLPVIVMEPCRGGRLANLVPEAKEMLRQARPEDSAASWAFRFVKGLPGVQVVLSGMTTLEQAEENVRLFSREDPLTREESAVLERATSLMMDVVPCTGCRYCCEGCPQGLDIPKLINMYNEASNGASFSLKFTLGAMTPKELPSACISCGMCRQACPQGIDVPAVMERYAKLLAQ